MFILGGDPTINTLLACGIERVHVQFRDPHKKTRSSKSLLILFVISDHMACILTEETLYTFSELL
jgi:tRNA G46 methylase TrmB